MALAVLEDQLDERGVRRLHVMGDEEIEELPVRVPAWATRRAWEDELRMLHVEVSWPVREFVRVWCDVRGARCGVGGQGAGCDVRSAACAQCPLLEMDCVWERIVLLWARLGGGLGEEIRAAARAYQRDTGRGAQYAFVPRGDAGDMEGEVVEDVMIIGAYWVPDGMVALWDVRMVRGGGDGRETVDVR